MRQIMMAAMLACSFPYGSIGASPTNKPFQTKVWGGVGVMDGDVKHQIGGHATSPYESFDVHFPISELKWPLQVVMATLAGDVRYRALELRGQAWKSVSDDAGKMEDSDWTDELNPNVKTVYSESDTDLDAQQFDGSLRYWLYNAKMDRLLKGAVFSAGFGAGLMYHDFQWDAKNLDQWYPQNPEFGHDRKEGTVVTYEEEMVMPYAELAFEMRLKQLTLCGSAGWSPYVTVDAEDDHILRYIRKTSDADGDGGKFSGSLRYDFSRNLFAIVQVDALVFDVEGKERSHVYDGPDMGDTWSIDCKIKSEQIGGFAGAGVKF